MSRLWFHTWLGCIQDISLIHISLSLSLINKNISSGKDLKKSLIGINGILIKWPLDHSLFLKQADFHVRIKLLLNKWLELHTGSIPCCCGSKSEAVECAASLGACSGNNKQYHALAHENPIFTHWAVQTKPITWCHFSFQKGGQPLGWIFTFH